MPAADAIALLFFLGSLAIGLPMILSIYRLGERKSFVVFAVLVCTSLPLVITAICLKAEPLAETQLQNLSILQALRATLLLLGVVLPVSGFFGWFAHSPGKT